VTQGHLPFALLGGFAGIKVTEQTFIGEEAMLCFSCPPDLAPALDQAWQERSRGGVIRWE
jgi:hypothetical protein